MLVDALKLIWRDLNTQTTFSADWYGWATNQLSHITVGMFLAGIYSFAYFMALNEFAYKYLLWAVVALTFAAQQGKQWIRKPADTAEDFIFVVMYGAGMSILLFHEVDPGSPQMSGSITEIAPLFAIILTHIAAGSIFRAIRQIKNGR